MDDWWAGAEPLISRVFNPRQPRGFHGKWVQIGGSDFTYDGPAGGGGHVRAVMAVADAIDPEPGGQDIAANLRDSARAMYRRDMPTAYRHLDGAAYLDGIYRGGQHRDDIEAIRRSYAKVPPGVSPEGTPPRVPMSLGTHQRELKGREPAPGVTGAYATVARKKGFDDLLHPRDPQGRWRKKAEELDRLAGQVQQEHNAALFGAGGFGLDVDQRNRAAVALRDAADRLRHGDLASADQHLAEARHVAEQMPGHRMRKHAERIGEHHREIRKHRGGGDRLAADEAGLLALLAQGGGGKAGRPSKHRQRARPPASGQAVLDAQLGASITKLLGSLRADLAGGLDWDPAEYLLLLRAGGWDEPLHPRFPSGGPHGGEFRPKHGGMGESRPAAMGESGGNPTVADLMGMVDGLQQQLADREATMRTEYADQLHQVTQQIREEQGRMLGAEERALRADELSDERKKEIVRLIAVVLGLVAAGALIVATAGLALPPLAEAGIAVGGPIAGELIAGLHSGHQRGRARVRVGA